MDRAALSGLPDSFILPDYEGGSLVNVPPTVGALLGATGGWEAPPLRGTGDVGAWDRVVLLLLDGMGWDRWQRALEDDLYGAATFWRQGEAQRITSVCPSTTAVATTVLSGNGAAPAQLGTLGYTQRLPDHGLLANMLFFKPDGDSSAQPGSLEQWGVRPDEFLPTPSLYQVLAGAGIAGAAILPRSIAGTPLSRMQLRGAEILRTFDFVDALAQLGDWLGRTERGYAYLYHPPFDTLSHRDGPDTQLWDAVLASITADLRRWLGTLWPAERRSTLLLVCADHGHVATPTLRRRTLNEIPGLMERSALRAGGEWRNRQLHLRPDPAGDVVAAVLAAARGALEGDAWVVPTAAALAAGLYGPTDRIHPEAAARLGELALIARGGVGLRNPGDHEAMLGMHGGLEPDEMWVPLIRLPLDVL